MDRDSLLLFNSVMLTLVSIVLTVNSRASRAYRKQVEQEREAAAQAIAAQKELISGQEQAIKGLRSYMQIKEEMLFDSIESLVTGLRYWMPDETKLERNNEPDEWYTSVNAIFLAEKRVREIKEAR